MIEFEVRSDGIQVCGKVLDTFLTALGPFRSRGERVLARACGVDKVDTAGDQFYPQRGYMEALKEFQGQFGPDFLQNVGALIFEKAIFPPDIASAAQALAICDTAYQMNHRNADGLIGGYHWTPAPTGGRMVCDNPYPCSFDKGILYGMLRRFGVQGSILHESPQTCRHLGAQTCTYLVEW